MDYTENEKYTLAYYILNWYSDGDEYMIKGYWPELLPYINGCDDRFKNYFDAFTK